VSRPSVFAHRGFAGVFPENTVAAVRGAAELGADAIEIDVQPTADGDVVVYHDRRLDGEDGDGLTDGTGVVWEQSTDAVTGAAVLDTDECVPLLSAVLSSVPDDVTVNIELKNPGSDAIRPGESLDSEARETARERWRPFVDTVQSVVDETDCDVLYSSFCEGALAVLESSGADDRIAALVAPNCIDAGLTVARRYDVDAVHPPVDGLDDRVRRVVEELGADCNVWTVRDWQAARTALAHGADGIIADYPGLGNGLERLLTERPP